MAYYQQVPMHALSLVVEALEVYIMAETATEINSTVTLIRILV